MRARDNPFSTDRLLRIRYRLQGQTWEDLFQRLEVVDYRGAIVGPEGAGKTTLMEDFEPRLRERGFEIEWLRLTREEPCFPPGKLRELYVTAGPKCFILFDGAEQLSCWSWWKFLRNTRRAGGLLITSHRAGLLPTLMECRTSQDLLASIVADLLREPQREQQTCAARLFSKHKGNLREALRELYDIWSERWSGPAECPTQDSVCAEPGASTRWA